MLCSNPKPLIPKPFICSAFCGLYFPFALFPYLPILPLAALSLWRSGFTDLPILFRTPLAALPQGHSKFHIQ
jgi:hypothetical protein